MKIVEIELQPGGVGARHGAWSLVGGTGAADDDASDDAREDASGVLVNRIVGQVPLCTFERSSREYPQTWLTCEFHFTKPLRLSGTI